MRRSLEIFPVFPHCADAFVREANIKAHGDEHLVEDSTETVPLDVRLQDFATCVSRLDEVLELEALSDDLAGMRFLICERVDTEGSFGCHWEDVALPTPSSNETFSLIAIAATHPRFADAGLSRLDVLLHEIAHCNLFGSEGHDLWFAALLNWQRLRCGLPLLSDPYDVAEVQPELRSQADGVDAEDALELAHEIASMFRAVRSREAVAGALLQLQMESWNLSEGESLRDRALELSSILVSSCNGS